MTPADLTERTLAWGRARREWLNAKRARQAAEDAWRLSDAGPVDDDSVPRPASLIALDRAEKAASRRQARARQSMIRALEALLRAEVSHGV